MKPGTIKFSSSATENGIEVRGSMSRCLVCVGSNWTTTAAMKGHVNRPKHQDNLVRYQKSHTKKAPPSPIHPSAPSRPGSSLIEGIYGADDSSGAPFDNPFEPMLDDHGNPYVFSAGVDHEKAAIMEFFDDIVQGNTTFDLADWPKDEELGLRDDEDDPQDEEDVLEDIISTEGIIIFVHNDLAHTEASAGTESAPKPSTSLGEFFKPGVDKEWYPYPSKEVRPQTNHTL